MIVKICPGWASQTITRFYALLPVLRLLWRLIDYPPSREKWKSVVQVSSMHNLPTKCLPDADFWEFNRRYKDQHHMENNENANEEGLSYKGSNEEDIHKETKKQRKKEKKLSLLLLRTG